MIFRRLFRFEPKRPTGIGGDQQHQLTSVSRVGPFERVDLKDSLRLRPGLGGSARTVRVRVVRLSALAVLAGVLAGTDEVSAADVAGALGWRRKQAEAVLAELTSAGRVTERDEDGLQLWST